MLVGMLWLLRGFGDEEVFVSSVEKKSVRVGNGERLGIGATGTMVLSLTLHFSVDERWIVSSL